MTFVGCDLHSRKQQVAVLDTGTGELLEQELAHEGDAVERFYRALRPPVTIGIEATGYTQWFHALMHRLGHTLLVGATLGTSLTCSAMIASRPSGSQILSPVTFAHSLLTAFGSSG